MSDIKLPLLPERRYENGQPAGMWTRWERLLFEQYARAAVEANSMKPIPVTARMPEEGSFFLAYGPDFGEYIGGPRWEICRWDGTLWNEGGTELCGKKMTHWMPLPAAPGAAAPPVAQPAERKPLHVHKIADLAMQSGAHDEQLLAFARAIEAAHGIGD